MWYVCVLVCVCVCVHAFTYTPALQLCYIWHSYQQFSRLKTVTGNSLVTNSRSSGKADRGQGFGAANERWIRACKSTVWIVYFCIFTLSVLLDAFFSLFLGHNPSYVLQHEDVLLSTHATVFLNPVKAYVKRCTKDHTGQTPEIEF